MSADSRLRRATRDRDPAALQQLARVACPCFTGWHPSWCKDASPSACACRFASGPAPNVEPPMLPGAFDRGDRCTLHDGWNLDDAGRRAAFLAWCMELTAAGAWDGQPHRDLLVSGVFYASLRETAEAARRAGNIGVALRHESDADRMYTSRRLSRLGW